MKKILSLLSVLLLAIAGMYGQQPAPGILNYQGVARNSVGNVLVNKNITLRLTIRDGSAAGPTVYAETRPVTTNPFGLFNVQLGSPGATSVTGSIPAVPWGVGLKYIQVEIDPNGGSSFINIGTAQLASVPYALYASTANDLVLPFIRTQADNGVLFSITNSGNNTGSRAIEGATNSTQGNAFAVVGTVTNAAPGGFSTGVRGINNGTGALGIGVWGSQAGTGYGVYATTSGGWALRAETNSGVGVYGQSGTGIGVQGVSNTGSAGVFNNTNAGNAAVTLTASSNGTGDVFSATTTGTGNRAGLFQNNNAANTQHVLAVNNAGGAGHSINSTTAGTGSAGLFNINNAASTATALQATTVGTGGAGSFTINNAAATADALTATTNGGATSWALRATSNGAQGAGIFTYNNTGGAANAVRIMNNGSGIGMFASTSGTGNAGRFDNTNATNAAATLLVNNNGLGNTGFFASTNNTNNTSVLQVESNGAVGSRGIRSLHTGTGSPLELSILNATSNNNVFSSTQTGLGRSGLVQIINASNTDFALEVFTAGSGWAGRFSSNNATPRALWTTGALRLAGINEGLNRVLTSIDALGNAQWQPIGAIGIVGGTGTLNRVAKWTPDGFNIGNSLTWDDGSRVRTGLGPTWTDNNTLTLTNTSVTGNDAVLSLQGNSGGGNSSGIYLEDATNRTHLTVNSYNAASGAKLMTWDGANLNVGINTATPNAQAKLHVDGSGAEFPYAILATSRTGTASFNTHGIWADGSWRGVYGTNLSTVARFRSIGVQGVAGGSNYSVEAVGVWAQANGTGTAGVNNYGLYATASGASGQNYAAWMNGTVRITDGTEGAGRVFTSDAGGNGSWQTPAGAGIVSGSGTLNYVPKWTPDGNTLGNSQIRDDGTRVSIGNPTFNEPNSVNIYPTSVTSPDASLQIGSTGQIFGMYTEDASGKMHFTANNPSIQAGVKIMTLDDDGVNGVGIGTVSPVAKLHALSAPASGGPDAILGESNNTDAGAVAIRGVITSTAPGAFSVGVRGINNGTSGFGIGVHGSQAGSGWGVYGTTPSGIGVVGASNSGTGVLGVSSTGLAGNFENSNPANTTTALRGFNSASNVGAAGIRAYSVNPVGTGYPGEATHAALIAAATDGVGIVTSSPDNYGLRAGSVLNHAIYGENFGGAGFAGVFGAGLFPGSNGVAGNAAAGTGAGGYFTGGTTALRTLGGVELTGINEAPNRILTTVSGTGQATWEDAATAGLVSGSGTLNFVPRWTPNGTTLGNSLIQDNGNATAVSAGVDDDNSLSIGQSPTAPEPSLLFRGFPDAAGIFLENSTGKLHLTVNNDAATGDKGLTIDDDAPTTDRTSVGIGTANPNAKLDVTSTFNVGFAVPSVAPSASGIVVQQNVVTGANSGIQAYANGATAEQYGVFGVVGGSSGNNVGGLFLSQTASAGTNYGIFARASGGANNYAGYFQGTVAIADGTQGTGYVFTSDASGNGSWQDLITPNIGIGLRTVAGGTSYPIGTTTVTQWATITHENGGANYNNVTGEYTITVSGVYQINASMSFQPANAGFISIQTAINGIFDNENALPVAVIGQYMMPQLSYLKQLTAGDVVTVRINNGTGAAQSPNTTFLANNFSVQLIHR